MTRALLDRTLERLTEKPLFALSSDERRVQVAHERIRTLDDFEQAVRLEGLGLAFRAQRLDGFYLDGDADKRERLPAEQYLTGLGSLLQSGCHVHRVAGDERLAPTGHDLAGVDADPQLDLRDAVPQLGGRTHGT